MTNNLGFKTACIKHASCKSLASMYTTEYGFHTKFKLYLSLLGSLKRVGNTELTINTKNSWYSTDEPVTKYLN